MDDSNRGTSILSYLFGYPFATAPGARYEVRIARCQSLYWCQSPCGRCWAADAKHQVPGARQCQALGGRWQALRARCQANSHWHSGSLQSAREYRVISRHFKVAFVRQQMRTTQSDMAMLLIFVFLVNMLLVSLRIQKA